MQEKMQIVSNAGKFSNILFTKFFIKLRLTCKGGSKIPATFADGLYFTLSLPDSKIVIKDLSRVT